MFPRRYFPGRYYAPRFFPQSQGIVPSVVGYVFSWIIG